MILTAAELHAVLEALRHKHGKGFGAPHSETRGLYLKLSLMLEFREKLEKERRA